MLVYIEKIDLSRFCRILIRFILGCFGWFFLFGFGLNWCEWVRCTGGDPSEKGDPYNVNYPPCPVMSESLAAA
jgi:hypothetical protein